MWIDIVERIWSLIIWGKPLSLYGIFSEIASPALSKSFKPRRGKSWPQSVSVREEGPYKLCGRIITDKNYASRTNTIISWFYTTSFYRECLFSFAGASFRLQLAMLRNFSSCPFISSFKNGSTRIFNNKTVIMINFWMKFQIYLCFPAVHSVKARFSFGKCWF